jgi:hypothetical protein
MVLSKKLGKSCLNRLIFPGFQQDYFDVFVNSLKMMSKFCDLFSQLSQIAEPSAITFLLSRGAPSLANETREETA